ncbi:MAG: DRTGG domain-containing protein [Christensenellales bacterium]|jgi:predicted transcriptional regulator
MKIQEIRDILDAKIICGHELMDTEVTSACASDMMSDVLAFVKDQAVLITGLNNPQVIRTALMMDMLCVIFVRGKQPDEMSVNLAKEKGIVILSSNHRMYTASGLLYLNGLRGGALDV